MDGKVATFEWPEDFDVPADVRGREIDGCTWALRLSLNVLQQSAIKGRTITLPNLLRFFDRRWSDYITVTGHAPPHARSRARALLTTAHRNPGGPLITIGY